MDRLNELTSTLNSVKKSATKIILASVPILKDLEEENNDLVEEVIEDSEDNDIDRSEILETLRQVALDNTNDAEVVMREIDPFLLSMSHGEEELERNQDSYPFLFEVWCGDIYESDGLQGLKQLELSLKSQIKNVTEEKIIETVIGMFSPQKINNSSDSD